MRFASVLPPFLLLSPLPPNLFASSRLTQPPSRSVKSRLDSSSGLSFTEFSYQLLQAYDFLRLHRDLGCTIQLGGSDQLGNIVSGIDMIRRDNYLRSAAAAGEGEVEGKEGEKKKDEEDPAFGLTFSLLTTASGEKFGKSAGNAIWLDPGMTSPFDVYQVRRFSLFPADYATES